MEGEIDLALHAHKNLFPLDDRCLPETRGAGLIEPANRRNVALRMFTP